MHNLTPTDILHLGELKAELRHTYLIRQAMGHKVKDMLEAAGLAKSALSRILLPEDKYPWDWYWSTLNGMAAALGLSLGVRTSGFELPSTPMLALGLENPAFLGVGAMESMAKLRAERSVSTKDFAQIIGMTHSWTSRVESSDDPELATLMKYATALGGSMRFVTRGEWK
jgi:transcriptional regulator with XRE-family HTH domain